MIGTIDRRDLLAALCALPLAAGLPGVRPAAAQDGGPTAVVERLHETLMSVMQEARSLGFGGRRDVLSAALPEIFAFPLMARIVAGRHWDGFAEADRAALVEAYRDLSVATYANRFDDFTGERFVTGGAEPVRGGSELVRTQILRPVEGPIEISYVVREVSGAWRIVDVILDGSLSEVSRQRAEYGSVLSRGGHAALMTELRAAIARQGA